ncbi:uncharacterized protein LOC103853640 isoform X1 [Brassica rapa]|uniref:uncharacterized protein LOC103853640 isoform X1 n=2 Tax=Brassica campestris TaxID=3711 RepID=UPI000872C445|nr:uncharacterized protein LOC103853640 isoform X1 [Brassica rapa]XP_033139947.1 uncharacterized protein LOC103853640 isoform X1 [Brassica rapa]XP_033139948.1 uncharacterized protein LOC103853640 isoform X1 [Brassica rapa]
MALILEAFTTLSFRIYHLHGVLATSHRLGIVIDTDLGKLRSALREIVNPYENAIFVIGKTLAPSDEDNFISCFGFVDSTTHGEEVFSLHSDNSPSHGFEDVLPCYRGFTPNFPLSEQPPVSCSGDWRRWAWTEMFRYGLGGTQTTRESNYFLTSYADCFSKCWRRAMGRHEEDG